MLNGLRSAIYPVADLQTAKLWYETLLGHAPYFESDAYIGFDVGGFELGLLRTADGASVNGAEVLWGVADAAATLKALVEHSGVIIAPLTNVGDNILTAAIEDPFGNRLGIIENPNFDIKKCR